MKKFMLLFFPMLLVAAESSATQMERVADGCFSAIDYIDNNVMPPTAYGVMAMNQCMGMVDGIVKTNSIMQLAQKSKLGFCPPENYTQRAVLWVVAKYMSDHPEYSNYDAAVVAHSALYRAYPCAQQ